MRWYNSSELNPLLKLLDKLSLKFQPYLMGSEDYMFLESIKHVTKQHKNSKLIIVEDSGHVVMLTNLKSLIFQD